MYVCHCFFILWVTHTDIKTGVISGAAGSAYVELDKTKVICGVYGPRQSTAQYRDKAEIRCDVRFATFSLKNERKSFQPGTEEAEMSLRVMEALEVSILIEKFPKSVIEINVVVLESNGNAIGASITASSLALADAGIVVYDLVAACTVARIHDQLVLDPSEDEEKQQSGSILIAYMPSLNQITQLVQTGEFAVESCVKAIDLCVSGCTLVHEIMKKHFLTKKQKKERTRTNQKQ